MAVTMIAQMIPASLINIFLCVLVWGVGFVAMFWGKKKKLFGIPASTIYLGMCLALSCLASAFAKNASPGAMMAGGAVPM